MIRDRFQSSLEDLGSKGLRRQLQEIQSPQGRTILHEGREYLNFSSNNYLGLANDPQLAEAFIRGIRCWGVGAGAARLINGSMSPFHQLEHALAEFKGSEAALLFNSGYHANVGALSCLAGEGDVIFSDELNHASIIDGIRLSKAQKVIYRHNDVEELRAKLQDARSKGHGSLFIVTESVFSMDGDLCRLQELAELAKEFGAILYLDEAHATGVFGESGAGLAESLRSTDVYRDSLIQMGTLGKALGCFGAYIAASKTIIDFLVNRARTFIYTTALPPALAEAALLSLTLVVSQKERREALWQRVQQFREGMGVKVESPIIPILVGDSQLALQLSNWLKEEGFWISAIRPPTVPEGTARLRITLMATHTEEDVRRLVHALKSGLSK